MEKESFSHVTGKEGPNELAFINARAAVSQAISLKRIADSLEAILALAKADVERFS